MKKFLFVSAIFALVTSSYANTVAVWNSQAALSNSNYAKAKLASIQSGLKQQQQQLQSYQANIDRLQQQYASATTDEQKKTLADQLRTNMQNYDKTADQVQNTLLAGEKDVLQKIGPKIQGITDALIKQKNIDVLIDNRDRNVTFVKPEWDITDEVTQKINEQVR